MVTLAPSVTEVVCTIGLCEKLVGVSDFDRYPKTVETLPRVGGLLTSGVESVVLLKPDIVVGLTEHHETLAKLDRLGIRTEQVDHRSVRGILDSISRVSHRCGVETAGTRARDDLEEEISRLKRESSATGRVRVLVIVGREEIGDRLRRVYVSGDDGFYSDILALVGAENVYRGRTGAFGTLSDEGIISLRPDYVIEMVSPLAEYRSDEELLDSYRESPLAKLAERRRVAIFRDDYLSVPGPRFISVARRFRAFLYEGAVQSG